MEVETTVDVFQCRYYRLNKMFLKIIGQWPYQSTRIRIVILSFVLLIILTHSPPQLLAISRNIDNWDVFLEGMVALVFSIFCVTKQVTLVVKTQEIKLLLHRIRTDWKVLAQDCDVDILHEYAEKGRTVTIADAILTCITSTLYIIQPVIPKIIDVLLRNGTEPGQFPVPVDYYYIDMQKNYFYIILHSVVCVSFGFMSSMSFNCMFVVNVQHGCGLFAILGYAEIIEETYSWCLFIVMGANMLMISLAGIQIAKITVDAQKTVRYIIGIILSLGHLFIENYMAQRLMDHSIIVHHSIINGEWYELPVKTQKLLLFMMMRSNVSCKLTAGKVFILSIETFTVVLKTSVSYFTLLSSV